MSGQENPPAEISLPIADSKTKGWPEIGTKNHGMTIFCIEFSPFCDDDVQWSS